MTLAWIYQKSVGNAGWVDVFWTAGMGLAGLALALAPIPGRSWPTDRQALISILVTFWALRLAIHLARRVAQGPEDVRYANFRTEWAPRFQLYLFGFLQIQAAAAIVLTLSVLLAARNPVSAIRPLDWLGAALLAVAIVGEAIADAQLARFKSVPANRGRVCDVGLWGWSRHPNYFFEWIGWLAYPVMAIDLSGRYSWGWMAFSAPAFMYWLLVHVSGIPPLEKQMLRSRGAAYKAYQAATHAFFPFPPRRASAGAPEKAKS
jgi:steroid 5-alpha reductase family enzyme